MSKTNISHVCIELGFIRVDSDTQAALKDQSVGLQSRLGLIAAAGFDLHAGSLLRPPPPLLAECYLLSHRRDGGLSRP